LTIQPEQAQKNIEVGENVLINGGFTGAGEDVEIQGVGMQVGTAIKPILFGVESYGVGSVFFGGFQYSQRIPDGPISEEVPHLL